jgi:carbonic anhydrase
MTPSKALEELMNGNERFATGNFLHPNRSQEVRESLSANQAPFAIVIGCSDSRASPEIVFDQGIGDLFVVRVAGHVVGPIEMSSVQFSALCLNSSLIFVLGHENCGAVQAVLQKQTQYIEPIAVKIEEAIKNYASTCENKVEAAVKSNVIAVIEQLKANPVFSLRIKENKLQIAGGYYHLGSGRVELCCDIPHDLPDAVE